MYLAMSLITAIGIFIVGFLSGTVTRWFAGIAAIIALILVLIGGVAPAPIESLVNHVIQQYYVGNELLFLSGFLFGIDAKKTKKVVVERTTSGS
jgi:membrane protein YdbS with pleckstrin-like domain